MMPDPVQTVSITLQVQEWNAIIETLAGAPWRIAQPLIAKVGQQLQNNIATQTMAAGAPGTPQRLRAIGDEPEPA